MGGIWSLLFIGLIGMAAGARATECVKHVRWNEDPPFHFQDARGEVQGLYPDLAREILARMGCRPQFVRMPWARALYELERGKLDLLPDAYRRPEREAYAYFSVPVRRTVNYLYMSRAARADYPEIRRLDDLRATKFRLGVQLGVSYGAHFDQLAKDPVFAARLVPITNWSGAIQMVQAGRLDGLIANDVAGARVLAYGRERFELERTQIVVADETASFAISKGGHDEAFVARFDATLRAMMADGSYLAILARHLPCQVSLARLGCEL